MADYVLSAGIGAACGACVVCVQVARAAARRGRRDRDGNTFCGDAKVYEQRGGELVPRTEWLALCENTLQERGWPTGVIMQVSGCRDEEESADAKDAKGNPCGACTQSFLRVMRKAPTQKQELSWAALINAQRRWLEQGVQEETPGAEPFTQLPKMSVSAWRGDAEELRWDLLRPASFTQNTFSPKTGSKRKALLIGINYRATRGNPYAAKLEKNDAWALDGCVPDQRSLYQFLLQQGWDKSEMTMLLDCDEDEKGDALAGADGWPSKRNIKRELTKLVAGLEPGDFVWLSFSGHGLQQDEAAGAASDEIDGKEENMFCGDGTLLEDDWLCSNVMCKVPVGCQMFALTDCCHSGTILDLPLDIRFDCPINKEVQIIDRGADGVVRRTEKKMVQQVKKPFSHLLGEEHMSFMSRRMKEGRRPE